MRDKDTSGGADEAAQPIKELVGALENEIALSNLHETL